jgi:hypothetical protein
VNLKFGRKFFIQAEDFLTIFVYFLLLSHRGSPFRPKSLRTIFLPQYLDNLFIGWHMFC